MSRDVSQNNKRIVRNAILMYIRMALATVIGLYTSRVVLAVLGVSDYGIYGLVGGVVGMLGFLNSTMSGATSRFLTFELGTGNKEKLHKTFVSAMLVHILIAVLVLVVAETAGLWFLSNKLVIPQERMFAAHWVYQLSILSALISITQVPYNACLIAHEHMDTYAYVEIANVLFKLGIVYLLVIGNFDKLILYAILTLAVSMVICMIYRIYCIRKFDECRMNTKLADKQIVKELTSFSLYNLLGNFGAIFQWQGTNFVVNRFWGVILNAAVSISTTVGSVISSFSSQIITVFRPVIIKAYAQNDIPRMQQTLSMALRATIIMQAMFAVPAIIEMDYVLAIWLKDVPEFSAIFCRLILVCSLFETIRYIFTIGIHATKRVKWVSIGNGILFSLSPVLFYMTVRMGFKYPPLAYVFMLICNMVMCIVIVLLLKHYVTALSLRRFCTDCIVPITLSVAIAFVVYITVSSMELSFMRLCITVFLSMICLLPTAFFFCLTKSQRSRVLSFTKLKLGIK